MNIDAKKAVSCVSVCAPPTSEPSTAPRKTSVFQTSVDIGRQGFKSAMEMDLDTGADFDVADTLPSKIVYTSTAAKADIEFSAKSWGMLPSISQPKWSGVELACDSWKAHDII